MKFSGKMWLMIILKVTKIFIPLYERHILENRRAGGRQLTPPAVYKLTLMSYILNFF